MLYEQTISNLVVAYIKTLNFTLKHKSCTDKCDSIDTIESQTEYVKTLKIC